MQKQTDNRRPHNRCLSCQLEQETEVTICMGSPKLDNRRLEKVAWSDESQFLLQLLESRVRIWHKQHESMDPFCLASAIQAAVGGVMVFSWHILGVLVPTEHCLNATANLSIVADLVHHFMTTVNLSCGGYFQQDNAFHKAQIISNWFLEHVYEYNEIWKMLIAFDSFCLLS